MSTWRRWVKYGQARLRAALSEGNAELDRREAALDAEAADKPWLRSTSASPTVEDVRARIEHDAAKVGAAASDTTGAAKEDHDDPDLDFDLREQKRQADERLAAIRRELGLGPVDRERSERPSTGTEKASAKPATGAGGAEPPAGNDDSGEDRR